MLLYTVPMNIYEYVPILINTSNTIIRREVICWLSILPLAVGYLLQTTSEYCILLIF